jgi:hypothetical protein
MIWWRRWIGSIEKRGSARVREAWVDADGVDGGELFLDFWMEKETQMRFIPWPRLYSAAVPCRRNLVVSLLLAQER